MIDDGLTGSDEEDASGGALQGHLWEAGRAQCTTFFSNGLSKLTPHRAVLVLSAVLLVAVPSCLWSHSARVESRSRGPAAAAAAAEETSLIELIECGPAKHGVDFIAGAGKVVNNIQNLEQCYAKCLAIPTCSVWTWVAGTGLPSTPNQCWAKSGVVQRQVRVLDSGKVLSNYVSGCVKARLAQLRPVSPYILNYQADHVSGNVPGLCQPGQQPALWVPPPGQGPHVEVAVLTYNLAWWSVFDKGRPGEFYYHEQTKGNPALFLIKQSVLSHAFDVMAFQECNDINWVLRMTGLAGRYSGHQGAEAVCLAFKSEAWNLISAGQAVVAEDTKTEYWGRRMAQWVRLVHKVSGKTLFFMNHHGPLPVSSGGLCGGPATASRLLNMIAAHAQHGETVILAGDFNAGQASMTVRYLKSRLNSVMYGTMQNGIDNIFSNLAPTATIVKGKLGSGGSDHDALHARLRM